MSEKPLSDQVALVTGASRGIGAGISEKLAELGAYVVVNYSKSASRAEEVLTKFRKQGGSGECACFDVSDAKAVEQAMSDLVRRLGRLDILINNAGITHDGLILRAKDEDWRRVLDVNLSSCFYCSRQAAKTMFKARSGRIISVSSVVGEMGNAGQASYAASKAGVIGLTKSLARELAVRGVTVNAVTPGYIQTEMTAGLSDEQRGKLLSQIPLNRLGTVEDVASLVGFLVLPTSSYITGQVIGINGGMYM